MRISDWSSDVCSSDLGADAGIHRFFEQVQRAGDIGVDEILPAVGRDMGLMQRGRVIDGPDAVEAVAEPCAVDEGADPAGIGRGAQVEADDRLAEVLQAADQRSEEHTSELQSLMRISYAVFCLKKK